MVNPNNNNTINATTSNSNSNSTTTTTRHGGACAACKYQRRRCSKDCPLAPYFPADHQRQFLDAHRLFGVHNIIKALRSVPTCHRPNAFKALKYTAAARARDPVGGCYRIIKHLEAQIVQAQAQLNDLLACLVQARARTRAQKQALFGGLGPGEFCDVDSRVGYVDLLMQPPQSIEFDGQQFIMPPTQSIECSEPTLSDEAKQQMKGPSHSSLPSL